MKDSFLHKKFIFNDAIDADFLFSLYEDDYLYMEEMFKTTLDQLINIIPEIPIAFNNEDMNGLRKIIHKIKPAFGFTGFLKTEKACKDLENACTEKMKTADLTTLYQNSWSLIVESMDIMQMQYDQLKEFNKP